MRFSLRLTDRGWKIQAPKASVDLANERLPQWAVRFVNGDTHGAPRRQALESAIQEVQTLDGDRRALYDLQRNLFSMPDIDMPLQHVFAPGIYLRTIFIPAGSVIVGKIHKHQHGNILSQGRVVVFTEFGGVERWTGPVTMVSEAGTKRAVYAETDTYWTTIHQNPTDTRDLAKLEADIIARSYAEYEQWMTDNRAEA